MKRIVLASVPSDTPLSAALESIHPKTRGVVVKRSKGKSTLITAGDIMEAINNCLDAGRDPGKVFVGSVIPAQAPTTAPPLSLPPGFSMTRHISLANGGPDLTAVESNLTLGEQDHFRAAFQNDDQRYVVQHHGTDWAVVVTASERYADQLNTAFIVCTCVGDPKHRFEPSQLAVPGKCNKPHGVKVNCS